uniref:Uncharacterized protein n=1 Tax=Panagrolaimus superbus TaxID=310955 RepID=A0A914YS23_9BILA
MFKQLFFIFICATFALTSEGLTCTVSYNGFDDSEMPSSKIVTNVCAANIISCVSVNVKINGKHFTVSDCTDTAATILTNYLQGQEGYKNEISFDCSKNTQPIVSYNDSTISYSYKCSNYVYPIPATTEKGDASKLSCFLSTLILSIVYIAFK